MTVSPTNSVNSSSSLASSLPQSGRLRFSYFWSALLITLFSTLLNIASLTYEEVIDDHMLLHDVAERGCGTNPAECFQNPVFKLYYRPLLSASFAFTVGLHGTSAWVHHLYNLLFHAVMIALVFWFFRLLLRRDLPALLAGTLFALHPLQVPVTTFIGGRTDTLALLFLMVFGIGAIVAGRRQAEGRSLAVPVIASVAGFAAAVFTKEQTILLVLLLPFLAAPANPQEPLEPQTESAVTRPAFWWLLYLLPIAAYVVMASRIIPRNAYEPAGWHLALHIEMVGRTLWYYAKALIFPTINTLHQSTLGHWDTPQPVVMVLGFFSAGIWLALIRSVWSKPALRLCWLWATLTLIPCLNIIPIPTQFVAPYRAVLPALGVCGLMGYAFAVWHAPRSARTALPLFFLLSFLYACIALADVPHWRNDITLIRMEVIADPDYMPAQAGLAGLYQGKSRYEEARKQYDEAVLPLLFPGAQTVEERIARVRSPELYRFLRSGSGLRYKPMELLNSAVRGSGGTHQALGQFEKAIADYRVALIAKPDDFEVRDYLAALYSRMGRYPQAEAVMRETLARAPAAGRFVRLAEMLIRAGRWKEAQEVLLEVTMQPDFAALPDSERSRAMTLYNQLAQRSEEKKDKREKEDE